MTRRAIGVAAALAGLMHPAAAAAQAKAAAARPVVPGLDIHTPAIQGELPPDVVALGRRLFHDPRLSKDTTLACAGCHRPGLRFADPRRAASGTGGARGRRNPPSLLNAAYRERLFWDGRARTLEEAVLLPVRDPRELDLDPAEAAARLRRDPTTVEAFHAAFGDGVTVPRIARALAAYVGSLRSGDAPLDRWLMEGRADALPDSARAGYRLFRTKAGCTACHSGPLLSDDAFHNTGVSWGGDPGRAGVTGREEDRGRFRTPSLRDVALTAPYMHDGSMTTLEEVVAFYARGGQPNPNLDRALRPLDLTAGERRTLVLFLRALTGSTAGPLPAVAGG